MTSLKQFVSSNRIHMDVEYANSNPNMAADDKWIATAHHYRCVLKKGSKRLTIPFSQGSGINREPTAEDVLDCLASDSAGIKNAVSFEDWCREYGYDTDSRKAEQIYKVCARQSDKLQSFLGTEAFESLLWNTDRL